MQVDPNSLAALLELPAVVQALRVEVRSLREELELLRKTLPPRLVTVEEAATQLGVSTVTVRRMVRSGELAHVRMGRAVRVDLSRKPVQSVNADDGRRLARAV